MSLTPEPVVTSSHCSVCGLPWGAHGKNPTVETCIELLKKALDNARRRGLAPY